VPDLLQLIYLGSGEVLRFVPEERDLLAVERKVNALWAAIARATETGDWRPRRSALCGWCSHQDLCPEFGGTPPPLPTPVATQEAMRPLPATLAPAEITLAS
jgi:putative RecB family exonuclease